MSTAGSNIIDVISTGHRDAAGLLRVEEKKKLQGATRLMAAAWTGLFTQQYFIFRTFKSRRKGNLKRLQMVTEGTFL